MSQKKLTQLLYRLPGIQRFIMRLADDLGERRNLLVLHPDWVDSEELLSYLREELWRRDFVMYEALLPEMPEDCSPAIALGGRLGVRWPASLSRTPANLVELCTATDIIQLVGLNTLPTARRRAWVEFLLQWSQNFQKIIDRGGRPTVICLICPAWAVDMVPAESLYLSVRKWWGIPSALEMQLLCRMAEEDGTGSSFASGWRESVISSIAGSDIQLAEWLWDDVFDGLDNLMQRLLNYALEKREWSNELLFSLEEYPRFGNWLENSTAATDDLCLQNPKLWGRGILTWTWEYGLEVNSSALALFGRREEIQHRLWRAQASLLLPQLDNLRLCICKRLTQICGPEWPIRFPLFDSEKEMAAAKENPYSCQWGLPGGCCR